MRLVDLRSDTVTKPSDAMRQAIASAEVGDDVFGEDPTVQALQGRLTDLFQKEAALFVSSGVMGNQLAIKAHTKPGDEVIVEADSHIIQYETAAPSIISGIQLMPITGEVGVLPLEKVIASIRPATYYFPQTALVCIENTHNKAGGTIYPLEEIKKLSDGIQEFGIKLHLDGARIWNASVATGIPPSEYAHYVDSISVCFSKGLGAPIGSVLLGEQSFIERAHKYRKILGGGMRQSGILAAACMYALENNVERLREDHEHALLLATSLQNTDGITVELNRVQTNIVLLNVEAGSRFSATQLREKLSTLGVLLTQPGASTLRAVTHLDVNRDDIIEAVRIIHEVLHQ